MKDETYFKVIFAALDLLVECNMKNRMAVDRRAYTDYAYASEFCTLRIDIGRQTGKTSWIMSRARKSDVIITSNDKLAENIRRETGSENVFSARGIMMDRARFSGVYEKIYIDNAVYISPDNMQRIYDVFLHRGADQTFIFVG